MISAQRNVRGGSQYRQVSGVSPTAGKKTAGQIDKEALKNE
ncbi:hypothetical protein D1AOALGA4SA_5931 [Olavius algarvensis Delta 1 endosymbiont]|nr:hypothetical protein D1AOALGA4SA_5931 [Olavius algarvensis Delta 1 endosymbiont]